MNHWIDTLNELDLAALKASDLVCMYATGQAISTGSGRNKQHYYRNGIQTSIGDIELPVWIKAVEYIIERDGLQEELEHLQLYAKQMPYDRQLDMCLSELYRDPEWVGFIPYNQLYHPELLNTTPIEEVVVECCQTPAKYLQRRYTKGTKMSIALFADGGHPGKQKKLVFMSCYSRIWGGITDQAHIPARRRLVNFRAGQGKRMKKNYNLGKKQIKSLGIDKIGTSMPCGSHQPQLPAQRKVQICDDRT